MSQDKAHKALGVDQTNVDSAIKAVAAEQVKNPSLSVDEKLGNVEKALEAQYKGSVNYGPMQKAAIKGLVQVAHSSPALASAVAK